MDVVAVTAAMVVIVRWSIRVREGEGVKRA